MSATHLGEQGRPSVVGIVPRTVHPCELLIKLHVYRKLGNLKAELCVHFQTPSWLFRIELLSMRADSLVSTIHSSHSCLWKFLYGIYSQKVKLWKLNATLAYNRYSVNNQLNLNQIACPGGVVIPVTEATCSAHSVCVNILPKINCLRISNSASCLW